jgi:UDP-glucose 4-epimerase
MTPRRKVIVTGGAGYIGSTICSALQDAGHTPIVWDSLVTGQESFAQRHLFFQGDIASVDVLQRILKEHPDVFGVIHCAARIIVPESMAEPYLYYSENVSKSLVLFESLRTAGIHRVVFSSSASVYAQTASFSVGEDDARDPKSPYARTKAMMEDILLDYGQAYGMSSAILRYFNPIGADPKLRTGAFVAEPSHLLGRLVATAEGKIPCFTVTGTEWPTRDGSGLRDYIHVWDLAQAHVAAIEQFDSLKTKSGTPSPIINLGTGRGVTVKEFLSAFQEVQGHAIPVAAAGPRPGDNAGCFTTAERARTWLGWHPQLTLQQGIASALEWSRRWSERPHN